MARVKQETDSATKKAEKVEKTAAAKVTKTVKLPAGGKETVKKVKAVEVKEPARNASSIADAGGEKAVEKTKEPKKMKPQSKEDTGSVDFQINNFSGKIKLLAKHLKTHIHDFDSRRGLLIMVGKRRRLMNYLKKSDLAKYEEMSKALKLKA